jgi:hypothetical protein
MSYVAGDILEITYNHPTIGSGTLYCKANEDSQVDPGGFRSEDDDAMVTGDGQLIDKINRKRWSYEAPPIAWDMTETDELGKLAQLAASPIPADWTISSVSGAIWGGKGKPVGDLKGATNTGQIPLKLSGGGVLKQIA